MIGQNSQQNSNQNCAIKAQNNVEVFYSEDQNVFYVIKEKHEVNKNFKRLINCSSQLLNDFLTHLAQFTNSFKPKRYTFKEMENQLNKRANNCKIVGNVEIKSAS